MHYTTLNKIRSLSPSIYSFGKLLNHLGKTKADDDPISMKVILDSNGIDDAIWCIRALDKQSAVGFAIYCAEKVLPIFEKEYPDDDRPRKAIEAAKNINISPDAVAAAADAYADAAYAADYASYSDADYAAAFAAAAAHAAAASAVDSVDAAFSANAAVIAADAAANLAGLNITRQSFFEQYFCQ